MFRWLSAHDGLSQVEWFLRGKSSAEFGVLSSPYNM
jgi:hypothetical protein